MITADLTKNPKQGDFVVKCLEAAFGDNPLRYLFYGGAIRGGKTYACLVVLIILCKIFPGTKWYVIRKSFTRIQETTLPTMAKILGRTTRVRWNRDKSNYYVEFIATGSRIYFAGEDLKQDPELMWMLGLECNGFFLEQVEELSEKCFEMCKSRAGSWYVDPMPSPLILGSFNPTVTWIRKVVHQLWLEGKLKPPFYYQEALPNDNPWVTDEQWKMWANMDDALYAQFVKGSWDFAKPANVFAYAFNEKTHHRLLEYNDDYPLYLSFDFNVEPITCICAQHDDFDFIHIFKEFRLINSDIEELCDRIAAEFPNGHFLVTGDATGAHRTALKKNLNYYKVIKTVLHLSPLQLKVPRGNPSVRNTRVLSNSLLSKHGNYWINTLACPHLTLDLNGVVVDDKGDIDKDKDKRQTHLLDAWRYYNWTFHRNFLDGALYRYTENE
jgi:hypothetical protein